MGTLFMIFNNKGEETKEIKDQTRLKSEFNFKLHTTFVFCCREKQQYCGFITTSYN